MNYFSVFKRTLTQSQRLSVGKFTKFVLNATPEPHAVKPLVRPVGLTTPPTSDTKYSAGNSFKDLFDKEKTDKRSGELGIEFNKTSMHHMSVFRKTNGRLFEPPKSYWRADKALYFPHLKGEPLSGRGSKEINIEDKLKDKISIVNLFSNKTANELADTSLKNERRNIDYLNKDFESLPKDVQIVQINLIDSKAKMLIFKLFAMRSLRSLIPSFLKDTYFICNRDQLPFILRENLHINNPYTGYSLLVDQNLKIRWMGSGALTVEDFDVLWKAVKGVKKEANKGNEGSSTW
ncbi:hypothetical protein TPHA_0B02220 [Tetrapisispora phaffii CBS 4417]|uniref:Mitochondrial ATPase complex subunit ATP10 n=1 Tax=Tetrapisispora phaffii (strain ATCC 24235 / CBS 4417 / NBRC 1672 / NRRL Y-8282 / UCD 70-5) TaxID=1071381 RepID=G8BPG3_TETPH|nr:hypothetical protein TPHA_0B02220 [Tetrapisispora phaffii CBS 4417]CCE61894.1 hypothetical protein TPHA_0B02220 [Tetrapisispora phaffii CBS 4417]